MSRLTDGLGWEWIFFINVPVGLALVLLSPMLVAETRDETSGRKFDVAGAVTITLGLVLAVHAIVNVPTVGWRTPQTLGLLAAAAVLIGVFVFIESRAAAPMVPLRIFRSRSLVGGNLTLFALGMSAYGMVFTLTGYAQQVLSFSAIQFGLMTAVMAGTAAASSFIAEAMVNRSGPRLISAISMIFVAGGLLLFTGVSADGTYMGDIFWGLLVFGPGLGAGFVAGAIASMGGVEPRDSGLAARNSASDTGQPVDSAIARTEGFQSAFTVGVVCAVLGLFAALYFLRQQRSGTTDEAEPVTSSAGS